MRRAPFALDVSLLERILIVQESPVYTSNYKVCLCRPKQCCSSAVLGPFCFSCVRELMEIIIFLACLAGTELLFHLRAL